MEGPYVIDTIEREQTQLILYIAHPESPESPNSIDPRTSRTLPHLSQLHNTASLPVHSMRTPRNPSDSVKFTLGVDPTRTILTRKSLVEDAAEDNLRNAPSELTLDQTSLHQEAAEAKRKKLSVVRLMSLLWLRRLTKTIPEREA